MASFSTAVPRMALQGLKTGTGLVGPLFWLCQLVILKQHKNNPELMLLTKDTWTATILDPRYKNYDLKINHKKIHKFSTVLIA